MIRLETSHTVNTTADFPDNFRILNGDGVVIVKNPATNEVVLQVPALNTIIIYNQPNPAPPPVATAGIPPAMQGGEGGS